MARSTLVCFAILAIATIVSGADTIDQGSTNVHNVAQMTESYGVEIKLPENKLGVLNGSDRKQPSIESPGQTHVAVSTVALLTLVMAAATGLGALPFFFVELQPKWAGICNGLAAGVMLAASFDLIQEGQRFGGEHCIVIGILMGGLFIFCCQQYLERFGEISMMDVKGADARKMVLVVAIMTLHSFGEGSGVGVSFAGPRGLPQGVMVTIAIAVHNIPEGLAVAMVLASRGVSARNAMLWSTFTSMPQALVAVPAFLCAETFHKFLPLCMGFAAGCMIWMVFAEVIPDSFKDATPSHVASAATVAVALMETLSALLENPVYAPRGTTITALLWSLLFGLGPFLGGLFLVLLASAMSLPHMFLMSVGPGIAAVLSVWRPLQLWLFSKFNMLSLLGLFFCGLLPYYALERLMAVKVLNVGKVDEPILPGTKKHYSEKLKGALVASLSVGFHAFAEGLTLGVAASRAYGVGTHMLLPIALHGLPRGAAVATTIYGASGSWRYALFAATLTGFAGPIAAILAILGGLDYNGLDSWMVIACGTLLFAFGRHLFQQTLKLSSEILVMGLLTGFGFASACVASTRIICMYTPYCTSAPEAVVHRSDGSLGQGVNLSWTCGHADMICAPGYKPSLKSLGRGNGLNPQGTA